MNETLHILTSSQARQIAENNWGRGGTSSQKTNMKGAFWFSCSAHGGFVVDGRIFSEEERKALEPFAKPEPATLWVYDGKVEAFRSAGSTRGARVHYGSDRITIPVYLFEEDCDWCLPYIFTKLRLVQDEAKMLADMEDAVRTFNAWHNPEDPRVKAREAEWEARERGDPDLIVAALREGNKTKVHTADRKQWLVTGYNEARDEFGTPWLSRCATVEPFAQQEAR